MVQLCRVMGVSPAVWADLVDAVYGCMQQDGQHADVPVTDEQNQACKLDISPGTIERTIIANSVS